jgi:hypothetical protein
MLKDSILGSAMGCALPLEMTTACFLREFHRPQSGQVIWKFGKKELQEEQV